MPDHAALRTALGGAVGKDLIVCNLPESGPFKWGSYEDIMAYSIAPYVGNNGTENLAWVQNTTLHPIHCDAFYRLKDGRMEQIGMSWCKHGFCALQLQTACVTGCAGGGGCFSYLLPGCGDTYTGSRAGSTGSTIGPHWQVNVWTGEFDYPPAPADTDVPSVIRRRLQVHAADLDPALNQGAYFFSELHYVHYEDAQDGNHYNNASHREFTVGALVNGAYALAWSSDSTTQVMVPAIAAWKNNDPAVQRIPIDITNEGQFLLYYKVSDNGDDTWHYEYAIYNVNSDRSVGSFSIPVPPGVTVSNVGFHDVDYHSGDPFSPTDWPGALGGGNLSWSSESYAENVDANALRFATTYNFRFDANTPPMDVEAAIGLFKPGTPDSVIALTQGPSPHPCPHDLNADGAIGPADLALLLGAWGPGDGNPPDFDSNGQVNPEDLAVLLGAWGPCPT